MNHSVANIRLDKLIFGRTVQLRLSPDLESDVLARELSNYPDAQWTDGPHLLITNRIDSSISYTAANPAIHKDAHNGFTAVFGNMPVHFEFSDGTLTQISYDSGTKPSSLRYILQKARSNQFSAYPETIGQRIHELLLVPSVFFNSSQFLLHATALEQPSGGALLIGGTGGVGKTSSELILCLDHGYGFISDDMSVIDKDGQVWPNLSFPKLYSYNLQDSGRLEQLVLRERSLLDRLHWQLNIMLSRTSLRRRMDPTDLYGKVANSSVPLDRYVILTRSDSPKLRSEKLSPARAASLSLSIMKSEYDVFFRQLHWHELNRNLQNRELHLSNKELFANWHALSTDVLNTVECELIHVPLKMQHLEFREAIVPLLKA